MAVRADLRETLLALIAGADRRWAATALASRARQRSPSWRRSNWTAKRAELVGSIEGRRHATPIDPDWLALQIAEALPDDAVVVNEGLTSSRQITRSACRIATATAITRWPRAASAGACRPPSASALANPPRPVCCFSGDGSAMYSIQSLWTAAHHKLPITYVIANNGGYRIIKQRLLAFHGNDQLRRHGFRRSAGGFRSDREVARLRGDQGE